MPHQCTNCDRTFADGSTEMLSGCPDCGGTKFQFRPDGFGGGDEESGPSADADAATTATDAASTGTDEPPEPPDRPGDGMTRAVGSAAATVKDLVSGSAGPDATQATPPSATVDSSEVSEAVTADSSEVSEAVTADFSEAADAPTETESTSEQSPSASPDTQTGDGLDDDIIVADEEPIEDEDSAQADARSALVEPDDVPESDGFDPAGGTESVDGAESTDTDAVDDEPELTSDGDAGNLDTPAESETEPSVDEDAADRSVVEEPDAEETERPSLAELREELNEQFESIRVVEPGQYELNLMELYDREEYIIALQEDGRYSIQVPETWREADA